MNNKNNNNTLEINDIKQNSSLHFMTAHMREYGILVALIVIMVFFQFVTDGILFRPMNITNLVLQNSYIVIMAIGMLLVIVCGHIDLSVGSIVGFIGALAAIMIVEYDINYVVAGISCLIAGGVIGAMQGYWIAYHKIPAFIVTLSGMLVFKGLTLALLDGKSIGPFPANFQLISSGFIPDIFNNEGLNLFALFIGVASAIILFVFAFKARQQQKKYNSAHEPASFFYGKNLLLFAALIYMSYLLATFRGIPNVFIIMALLVAAYSFVANNTILGRRIYAIGGNAKAAKLSGINAERLTFFTFVNMGVLAALAGLVFAARLNTATPKAGLAFELDVIAAVFIGGASVTGGVGRVTGAVIGALIMGVMNNGMSILGIGIDWQQVIKGLVLLSAVVFDLLNKHRG